VRDARHTTEHSGLAAGVALLLLAALLAAMFLVGLTHGVRDCVPCPTMTQTTTTGGDQ
jgi:hypothetical protein